MIVGREPETEFTDFGIPDSLKASETTTSFSEEHISVITDTLAEESNNWKKIGLSLKLPEKILSKITTHSHEDSKLSLSNVLREWIASGKSCAC